MANRHFPPVGGKKTSEEDQRNSTVFVHVPKVIEERDEIQMDPESRESPHTPAVLMAEDVVRKECECQQDIDQLQERIRKVEEQRVVERFGVRRFMASDSDMRFYAGLPDYQTFISLYNFLKPRLGFSLNYYNDIQMFLNTRPMLYPEVGLESYMTLMSCF